MALIMHLRIGIHVKNSVENHLRPYVTFVALRTSKKVAEQLSTFILQDVLILSEVRLLEKLLHRSAILSPWFAIGLIGKHPIPTLPSNQRNFTVSSWLYAGIFLTVR